MTFAQRAVDSTFRALGITAVLDPDDVARDVLILPARADEMVPFGTMDVLEPTGLFEIRVDDFAGFGVGAVLQIGEERRVVQAQRVPDPRRLKIVLDTVEAD